jgi:hypothetical protein
LKSVGADDGEGNVMADAGGPFGGVDVSAGRFEEFQHCAIFPGWRVGDVDDDGRAGECVFQAFTREHVDTRGARGGQHVVAIVPQDFHQLGTDEAAAADDDDFHGNAPSVWFTS